MDLLARKMRYDDGTLEYAFWKGYHELRSGGTLCPRTKAD